MNLSNLVLPSYLKYVAYGALAVATFAFGYVKGQAHVYEKGITESVRIVTLQGKTTQKVITKYIKQKEKQDKIDENIKHEGQSYAIRFPNDDYHFNNFYVRMHDASVKGDVPSLSSGDLADPSGVSVSRHLEVSLHNNIVGRQWKDRAQLCEDWALAQEKLGGK